MFTTSVLTDLIKMINKKDLIMIIVLIILVNIRFTDLNSTFSYYCWYEIKCSDVISFSETHLIFFSM